MVTEKTIIKNRTRITLYREPISVNADYLPFRLVMDDIITDETKIDEYFGTYKEAIEYFSSLYDTL